jgi:hypothetical protein
VPLDPPPWVRPRREAGRFFAWPASRPLTSVGFSRLTAALAQCGHGAQPRSMTAIGRIREASQGILGQASGPRLEQPDRRLGASLNAQAARMTLAGVDGEGLPMSVGQGFELRQQAERPALSGCGHSHFEYVVRAYPQAVRFALAASEINDGGQDHRRWVCRLRATRSRRTLG